jgi:transposase-like protein
MKVEQRWCYLWAAVDTENGELLGIQLTPTRDGRDAYRVIRRALKACTNTPTVVVGRW